MKVKIFRFNDIGRLSSNYNKVEEEINNFIKGKSVINIKVTPIDKDLLFTIMYVDLTGKS